MSTPPDRSAAELVTVVMPVYNGSAYLQATLDSVLGQTHDHLELIVVDDGSTDGSAAIVEHAARADPRVRLLRQQNSGVAAARNRAIAEAAGTYIAPIDADDLWHPEKLAAQLSLMRPEVGMVYAWHTRIDTAGNILGPFDFRPTFSGEVLPFMVLHNLAGASVPLLRTDLVRRLGGYDVSLRLRGGQGSEDWLLQCRMAAAAEVDVVPRFLIGYRQVPGSMSRDSSRALASHLVATSDIGRAHPGLDPQVLRWSEVIHALWLAANSYRSGNRREARRLGWWAIRRQFALDHAAPFRKSLWRFAQFRWQRVRGRIAEVPPSILGGPFIGADLSPLEAAPPHPGERARYAFMIEAAAVPQTTD